MEEQKNKSIGNIALRIFEIILGIIFFICGIYQIASIFLKDSEASRNTTLVEGNNTSITDTTQNNEEEYNVGEIYQDKKIAIKFVSTDENFKGYSKYADIKSGYKILKANFEIENLGDSDIYVSTSDFSCYADGYDCEMFWQVDDAIFSSTLSTGKKTAGSVYFEVPENVNDITIEFTDIFISNKVVFRVK